MASETILCISTRLWHSLWRDGQQIMSRLARSHRVIFVEPQRDPDISYTSDFVRRARYYRDLVTEEPLPNLTVVRTPPALPYARQNLPATLLRLSVPVVAQVNNLLMLSHLGRVKRAFGLDSPILWLYDPRQAGLIGHLGEKLVVYFNYDELADFAPNKRIRGLLQRFDDRLVRRADVVIATSQGQTRRRIPLNPATYFVPNGVDHANFSRALDPATAVPAEVANLPRPILGFAGWLGNQVDVPLLVRLAQAYPQASVVLVGPDALDKDAAYAQLRAMPNVTFAGRKALEALPGYLKAFDVALLPYRMDGHTHSIYPLKLHEYLAAGRSMLATNLPELQPFTSAIRVAADGDEFLRLVPVAAADNAPERQADRSRLARQHTWDQRVITIEHILDRHLAGHALPGARALWASNQPPEVSR